MSEIQSSGPSDSISFIYGHVDQSLFPIEKLCQAGQITCTEKAYSALNYGSAAGYSPLLDYIRCKLSRDEKLEINPTELMLIYGSSGGLDLAMRMFSRPGDTVLAGAPSYHEALAVISDYPIKLAPIPLDGEGLLVDVMAERLKELVSAGERPSMVYTIPSFQNPSGITLSEKRRARLLELADQYELIIIEDDVYRDLYFTEPPPASMFAMKRDRVLRLNSFSKILAPGLRLGWVMGPAAMLRRMKRAGVIQSGGGINPFTANMVANFCISGWMEPHIEMLRGKYRERRDKLLAALEKHMPGDVQWTTPDGGFFIWLTLPESAPANLVIKKAVKQHYSFLSGESFFPADPSAGLRHIRLSFSFVPPDHFDPGIKVLADAIREM